MSEIVLNAELRTSTGKHTKYSRSKGMVPGVFYSRGEQNIKIEVPTPTLDQIVFTSKTNIITLRLNDGSSRKCILKDVQFDPVTDRPIHFDLLGLHEGEKLTVKVPVLLIGGTASGVKEGGILQHSLHKLTVSCLPTDIPEKVEVDVANLGINDFIHVSDLVIPNVTILDGPATTVAGVIPPTLHKEEVPAEAAVEQPVEPEVLGKGKKAEEGEEAGEGSKTESKG